MRQEKSEMPARMEKLSVLPVFFGLEGHKVLVVGGSEAAAWKTELLLATGAKVDLFATDLSEGMLALIDHASLAHHASDWRLADARHYRLVIADLEDETEAAEFAASMMASGVPTNVIDKPAFCTFQFGSIVNRSPVVVGISTDGAAPILGQAIRRRIETLLPKALSGWAALARQIRAPMGEKLRPGVQRRAFWEHFVDRVFASPAGPDDTETASLLSYANDVQSQPPVGSVTLVGAGPGDPELLTLKAMRALQSADVILFDDLVSQELLEMARREAKRTLVGKRGGRESCKQEDINAMMLAYARAGKRVVRLKAGDPSIFGRSGEEIAYLEKAGISVSVIPGITAASALAAGTNTSLTHRDCAQSVRFVTGHSRKGVLPETIDWRAVADPSASTVFYMGGRTAGAIRARLLEHGMSAHIPVIIASNVSRKDEQRWHGILEDLEGGIREIGLDKPVLIAVGEAFGQRDASLEQPKGWSTGETRAGWAQARLDLGQRLKKRVPLAVPPRGPVRVTLHE